MLLVAACGGEEPPPAPKLPAALAERLAARSDAVAERLERGDPCAAHAEAEALHAAAIAAVNAQQIPQRFHEELLGSVAALVESIECVPPPPPPADDEVATTETEIEEEDEREDEDDGRDEEKGKDKGKKKGKDKD